MYGTNNEIFSVLDFPVTVFELQLYQQCLSAYVDVD